MNNNKQLLNEAEYYLKNYKGLGGCYAPQPTASMDNTNLDLHNSSDDTWPHSINCFIIHSK